jgi:hypothetical protein
MLQDGSLNEKKGLLLLLEHWYSCYCTLFQAEELTLLFIITGYLRNGEL